MPILYKKLLNNQSWAQFFSMAKLGTINIVTIIGFYPRMGEVRKNVDSKLYASLDFDLITQVVMYVYNVWYGCAFH